MAEDETGGAPVPQDEENKAAQGGAEDTEPTATPAAQDGQERDASDQGEAGGGALSQDELDKLAQSIDGAADEGGESAPAEDQQGPTPDEFELPEVSESPGAEAAGSLDLLMDVQLDVKIELGRTRMLVEDVLKLTEGSVVELDKLAGDPVDILVNDRLIAKGEIVILDDNFCVRIAEVLPKGNEEAE